MLGAIIGDMVGSIYESQNHRSKDFEIVDPRMRMTDDTLLTLAVAKALLKHYPIADTKEAITAFQDDLAKEFVVAWKANLGAGWGGMFFTWCSRIDATGVRQPPYRSYGNGSAMRIAPVGWIAKDEAELKFYSRIATEITHDHPDGIKGAEAVALCIYMALHGASKEEIRKRMVEEYYPSIAKLDYDGLVSYYPFDTTCPYSVPQAIYCFLISKNFEDAIRTAISIGGDSDTIAAMAGSIAEAYYQKDMPSDLENRFLYWMIDSAVEKLVKEFHRRIGSRKFD